MERARRQPLVQDVEDFLRELARRLIGLREEVTQHLPIGGIAAEVLRVCRRESLWQRRVRVPLRPARACNVNGLDRSGRKRVRAAGAGRPARVRRTRGRTDRARAVARVAAARRVLPGIANGARRARPGSRVAAVTTGAAGRVAAVAVRAKAARARRRFTRPWPLCTRSAAFWPTATRSAGVSPRSTAITVPELRAA
jgi:hypothetical protein